MMRKIKSSTLDHAEYIYRSIIYELMNEAKEDGVGCDHAKLAVPALLLALLQQKMKLTRNQMKTVLNLSVPDLFLF